MDEDYVGTTEGGACAKDDEQMDTSDTSAAPDAMDTSEPHGSSSSAPFDYPNRLFHPEAFQHNCTLTIEKHPPKCIGCHDLDCLLHALAHGVVVASIDKLPGDGLPQGVYQIRMSCRKDVPTPNPKKFKREAKMRQLLEPTTKLEKGKKDKKAKTYQGHKTGTPASNPKKFERKAKICQRHKVEPNVCQTLTQETPSNQKQQEPTNDTPETPACTGFATFEYSPYTPENQGKADQYYVKCPLPEPLLPEQRNEEARQEHGLIKFKLKTQLKTVYNPAIWTRKKLARKCSEAFENAINGMQGGECDEKLERWIGPFMDDYDKKKYWFEGYYEVIKEGNPPSQRKRISSFYFIHPDTLEKRRKSTL